MKDKLPPIEELNRLVRNNTAFTSWDDFRRAMQPRGYDQVYMPTLRTDIGDAKEMKRLRQATQDLGFKVWPDDREVEQRRLAKELGRPESEPQKEKQTGVRIREERSPNPRHVEQQPKPKVEVRPEPGWTKSDLLGAEASRQERSRRRARARTGPDL